MKKSVKVISVCINGFYEITGAIQNSHFVNDLNICRDILAANGDPFTVLVHTDVFLFSWMEQESIRNGINVFCALWHFT
jgi:hypothetical protein